MSFGTVYQALIRKRLYRKGLRSDWITIGKQKLHALTGDFGGPFGRIVLIHGLGANSTSLSPLIKRLLPHFQTFTVLDLIGHGLNDDVREDLPFDEIYAAVEKQLLHYADEESIALFGTSLGGGFALRFASKYPELVSQLVLVSPAGAPLTATHVDSIRRLFTFSPREGARPLIKALFHEPPWYGSVISRELKVAMERPIVRAILDKLEDVPTLTEAELSALRMPILLVWGQSERVLPRRALNWFLTHLPDQAQVLQPFGYGHSPHLEESADLARRILHFFSRSHRGTVQ